MGYSKKRECCFLKAAPHKLIEEKQVKLNHRGYNMRALNTAIEETVPELLPIIPTMDVVVFPQMIVPLLVLDERIINGINQALSGSKKVLLLAAKKKIEDYQSAIGTKDLYEVGTISSIMRLIKIPEGGVKILVQGIAKARVKEIITNDQSFSVLAQEVTFEPCAQEMVNEYIKVIKELAEQMSNSNHSFSPDFHIILSKMHDPQKIADFILSHLNLNENDAQRLLEAPTQVEFLSGILEHLHKEVEVAETQERIRSRARDSMNKAQKEFYLREQLKAIKQELGEDDAEEIEKLYEKLDKLIVAQEVKEEVKRQISRLERTAPDSLEATVTRNYLEWIFALPWNKKTKKKT